LTKQTQEDINYVNVWLIFCYIYELQCRQKHSYPKNMI